MNNAHEASSEAFPGNLHQSSDQILPLVYSELRKLAAVRIAQEAPGNTLQPTALVHEAWLRLALRIPRLHLSSDYGSPASRRTATDWIPIPG